jgi:NTP pyrophosphatase (non-canonical NTP hydrolase)
MEILTKKIKQWAIDRNLHTASPINQMLKLLEESGELASGIAKNNKDVIIDSIGDIFVVLTILSMQLDLDLESCVELAYNEMDHTF